MRKRKWAIIAFILLVGFIFMSLEAWRLSKASEKLKRYILSEFRPSLGERLYISRVHVSFGNIHVMGLRYTLPAGRSSVYIKHMRLGYNFFNLMVRGFDLQYISQDVLFDEPTFYISAKPDSVKPPYTTGKQPANFAPELHLESPLKGFEMFHQITLTGGRIVYSKNDTSSIVLVHSLQGGIFRSDGDSAFIHLDGSFLNSSGRNVNIIGKGSLKDSNLSYLRATFSGYDLRDGLPFLNKQKLDVYSGYLDGQLQITQNEITTNYELNGDFSIRDGAAVLLDENINLSELFASFLLQKGALHIKQARVNINESPAEISGTIINIRDPKLDLMLKADSSQVAGFTRLIWPKGAGRVNGIADLTARVSGPLDSLKMVGTIASPKITARSEFRNVFARVTYENQKLLLERGTASLFGQQLALTGSVDFSSPEPIVTGKLHSIGSLGPFPIPGLKDDSLATFSSSLEATITGALSDPQVKGTWSLTSPSGGTWSIQAPIWLHNGLLQIEIRPSDAAFYATCEFDLSVSPPNFSLSADRIERLLAEVFPSSQLEWVEQYATLSLQATGSPNSFIVQSMIERIDDSSQLVPLLQTMTSVDLKQKDARVTCQFSLHPGLPYETHGDFILRSSAAGVALDQFELGSFLTANAKMNSQESRQLSGSISAHSLSLARFAGIPDSLFAGRLDMNVSLAGTISDPHITGGIEIHDFRYRDIGDYDALADFAIDSTTLNLNRLLLNQGGSTLLYSKGAFYSAGDSLNFVVKGAGFDAGMLLRKSESSMLSGSTFVNLLIEGRTKAPDIKGVLAIKEGVFYKFPFDEMEIRLGKSDYTAASPDNPRLYLDNFRLTRFNDYEITGSGIYPLSSQDSIYISLTGRGNLLRMLPDLTPYFSKPESDCSLAARITGTPVQPRVDRAELQLKDASLNFRSVVPQITKVNGAVVLDDDGQFVRLDSLTGFMGGKPFRIYNQPADQIKSAVPLQNMTIADSDIHFGVFVLETPGDGVPLNFVGLMRPGDFALLDLQGKEEGEKFYFGKGRDAMTLRGKIMLHGGKIMYPFYDGGKTSPGVKEFLENMQWDLLVIPARNTRFVRTFPGAIDEIYVDLKLDDQYGGLDFSGRLADESFRINGQVRSTKGFLEYLDLTFRLEQAGIEFDRGSLIPVAYGRAKTTVTDSLGMPSNIYLTMQTVDNTMDKKSVDDIVREEKGRARLDRIRFKLSSDNPNIGATEAQIMASLGYSANDLQSSALEAIGFGAENLILRPLFRPVERGLERRLGLDYVRFSSQLTKNIILFNLNDNLALNSRLALLQSTKVMVGKYLADRFFIQYTGQIESGVGYRYRDKELGFRHTFGLEYQISPQVLLELEYDYDSLMLYNREDKRIVLRHWFPF